MHSRSSAIPSTQMPRLDEAFRCTPRLAGGGGSGGGGVGSPCPPNPVTAGKAAWHWQGADFLPLPQPCARVQTPEREKGLGNGLREECHSRARHVIVVVNSQPPPRHRSRFRCAGAAMPSRGPSSWLQRRTNDRCLRGRGQQQRTPGTRLASVCPSLQRAPSAAEAPARRCSSAPCAIGTNHKAGTTHTPWPRER